MRRLLVGALVALAGCRAVPATSPSVLAALAARPQGYLLGAPRALGARTVLNREDFVYDARLSPDGTLAAVSRLGPASFHLSLHELVKDGEARRRADVALNPLEFDVEGLAFSPDGARVATVSRDGALRLFSSADGAPLGAWLTDEPLVSVAFSSDGALLALGSAKGLVTVLRAQGLGFLAELRAHADEVRGLAFTPRGTLVSGGWDARVRELALAPLTEGPGVVRTRVTRLSGLAAFRAVFDGAVSATVVLDARLPLVVVRPSLARALGLDVARLTETASIPTAYGLQLAPLARGRRLAVKQLTLEGVDLAVCEACVPAGAEAALGGPALEQVTPAFDDAAGELVLRPAPTASRVQVKDAVGLVALRTHAFPAPVNDLTLDARGETLGLAFSETKAERTRAVYEREKAGQVEPARDWDCAARVALASGAVLQRVHGHRGVVATAAISPDGQTLATGGWDRKVILHGPTPSQDDGYGWSVRRVRFSRDGRRLVVAAWTPQVPTGDHQSDPAAVVYEVAWGDATVAP